MYKWYKMAEVCYVYLSDVNIDKTILDQGKIVAESRWFTRGWTLQEVVPLYQSSSNCTNML